MGHLLQEPILLQVQKIAQWLEFAGYGPAVAVARNTIKLHYCDQIHILTFNAAGVPNGFAPALVHQNPARPETQAVFSTLFGLTKKFKQPPPLGDVYTQEWTDVGIMLRVDTNYAWLCCPTTNAQMVFHELSVNHVPIWHSEARIPYGAKANNQYFVQVTAMLQDFIANGQVPPGLEQDLMEEVMKFYQTSGAGK